MHTRIWQLIYHVSRKYNIPSYKAALLDAKHMRLFRISIFIVLKICYFSNQLVSFRICNYITHNKSQILKYAFNMLSFFVHKNTNKQSPYPPGNGFSQALDNRFLIPKNEAQCSHFRSMGLLSWDIPYEKRTVVFTTQTL